MTLTIHNNKGEFTVSLEDFAEKFHNFYGGGDTSWIKQDLLDFLQSYSGDR